MEILVVDRGQQAAATLSRCTALALRSGRMGKLTRTVAAVGLVAMPLVGCAAHATSGASVRPGSAQPSSSSPVASVVTSPPPASQAPCPSDSGWTGQNLSMAPPNPAAWLTAAQLPDAAVHHWTAQGPPAAMPFVQDMWNDLNDVSASNFLAWQVQFYGGANGAGAGQTIYLYASEAQAYCAYQGAVAGAARNQADMRSFQAQRGVAADAVTTETVSGGHYSAWTQSWTAPSSPANTPGPQTDVEYMAQAGTALTFVSFDLQGMSDSVPDAAEAQAILNTITQHLSVYASGS